MYTLDAVEYVLILPLLRASSLSPVFAYSVVYCVITGEVLVNLREAPSCAIIKTSSGIYALIGEPDEQAVRWIRQHYDTEIEKTDRRFTLFSPTAGWNLQLERAFGDVLSPLKRQSFSFDRERYLMAEDRSVPEGFRLCPIDERAIASSSEFGADYYQTYWGDQASFLRHGFGFYVEHKGEIVSEGTSIFANPEHAEIDIATSEHHRGMGLGYVVARAFIQECLKQAITPHWDCHETNTASRKMAEKLGFTQPEAYTIFTRRKR